MGLFDGFQFDPQSYGGVSGLLGMLTAGGPTGLSNNQPSPLDNAQWPAGPMGAPQPQQGGVPDYGQTRNIQIGSGPNAYMMPQFGDPPAQDPAALPPNARPTSGLMPQQSQQMQPQAAPQQEGPGFGDRLMAGLQGFGAGGRGGGFIGALSGGINGLTTGATAPTEMQKQQAIYSAVLQQPGMTKQKAFIIATNPKAFEAYSAQLFDNNKYGFTKLDDGTIVRQNPQNGSVETAYQSQPKADFGVVDKQDGRETYGWIDKNKRTVSPLSPVGGGAQESITGPDGKQIAIPPGVDRQTFVKEVSRAGAKAAAGEKTEVQAKSEKFGNKMETAEKNISQLQGEGTGYYGRSLEGAPLIGGTMATNWLQSEDYQKYKQGRDNFITALLRDESGAAIGTEEFKRYEKELFPQPGDKPGTIAQKAEARRVAIEAMKKSAGPGYKSPAPAAGKDAPDPLGIR